MWPINRKPKNRRASRRNVLDVKLRSDQVRRARLRFGALAFGALFGTAFGLYLLWRVGEWTLNRLVYENRAFALQHIDLQTDGVIAPDQLQRWMGVSPGQNLFALDLARVKRDLEMVPLVGSVSIERILPNTLRVRVTERRAVAQINVPRAIPQGGVQVHVFQLDAEGHVLLPLDPRQRTAPLSAADGPLPVLTGVNWHELQPGRRLASPQVQAALRLIAEFGQSPMAGLVDLQRIDVGAPDVLVVRTGQGSEITFRPQDLPRQLRRWREIHDLGLRLHKTIATLDLAVTNNIPARWSEAGATPDPSPQPRPTARLQRKNV